MNKPKFIVSEPHLYYADVRDYIKEKYPSINMREVWLYLCEEGYVRNDSFMWFHAAKDYQDEDVQEFAAALKAEYEQDSFYFYIEW